MPESRIDEKCGPPVRTCPECKIDGFVYGTHSIRVRDEYGNSIHSFNGPKCLRRQLALLEMALEVIEVAYKGMTSRAKAAEAELRAADASMEHLVKRNAILLDDAIAGQAMKGMNSEQRFEYRKSIGPAPAKTSRTGKTGD